MSACHSHSWLGHGSPAAVYEYVSTSGTWPVVQMSRPARSCQKVSACAAMRKARSATTTNSDPTTRPSNDSPRRLIP